MSYSFLKENTLQCILCPHTCAIQPGETGICRVRGNNGKDLSLPFFGRLSAMAVDPIEKKPLYHFHPGENILSIGFYGCNLRCPFCQNYHISQRVSHDERIISPEECVNTVETHRSFGIAYTYSEPLVHFEYIRKTAELARDHGVKNVLVTNGYLNPAPARELLPYIDAANVDLKSFSNDFYTSELGGGLSPVLRFIEAASETIHLEVTTLVIPGKNDSDAEMLEISRFLASLNPDIPLHLSAYYPTFGYSVPATRPETIMRLLSVASEYLRYVYPGNIAGPSDTLCPDCGEILIERRGYHTRIMNIKNGSCGSCGRKIPIIFN